MENILRSYVRLLIEKAVSIEEVGELALMIFKDNVTSYLLYDPKKCLAALDQTRAEIESEKQQTLQKYKRACVWALNQEISDAHCIVGYMEVYKSPGQYSGGSIVSCVAAEKGFGPLLYDIVMAHEGGLTSDREQVSASARKVWEKYADRRDVTHVAIDDVEDPKTPPTIDDGELAPTDRRYTAKKNPLNYVYFSSSASDIKTLVSNHQAVAQHLLDLEISENDIERALVDTGNKYFQKRFHYP